MKLGLVSDTQNFLAERLRQANTREAVLDAVLRGCGVLRRFGDDAGAPGPTPARRPADKVLGRRGNRPAGWVIRLAVAVRPSVRP